MAPHPSAPGHRRGADDQAARAAAAQTRPRVALRLSAARRRRRRRERGGGHLPLPGSDHSAGGHRGRGQHRGGRHCDSPGRSGRPVLDVGHGPVRHGLEIRRSLPRGAVPHRRRPRAAVRRPSVLPHARRARRRGEGAVDLLRLRRHSGLLRHRLDDAVQRGGGSAAQLLRLGRRRRRHRPGDRRGRRPPGRDRGDRHGDQRLRADDDRLLRRRLLLHPGRQRLRDPRGARPGARRRLHRARCARRFRRIDIPHGRAVRGGARHLLQRVRNGVGRHCGRCGQDQPPHPSRAGLHDPDLHRHDRGRDLYGAGDPDDRDLDGLGPGHHDRRRLHPWSAGRVGPLHRVGLDRLPGGVDDPGLGLLRRPLRGAAGGRARRAALPAHLHLRRLPGRGHRAEGRVDLRRHRQRPHGHSEPHRPAGPVRPDRPGDRLLPGAGSAPAPPRRRLRLAAADGGRRLCELRLATPAGPESVPRAPAPPAADNC